MQPRTFKIESFDNPFSPESLLELEELLPEYVQSQRWYRSKAKHIRKVAVRDVIAMPATGSYALVVHILYTDEESDTYLLPVSLASGDGSKEDVVAHVRTADGQEGTLFSALASAAFRSSLLEAITGNQVFSGLHGELVAEGSDAFTRTYGLAHPVLESKVSRAEQSNSSIVFSDKYILKLFRKLETGINPDIEVGKFLTSQGFAHTPAVLGEIQYRTLAGDFSYAGLLQSFVANEGDAWKYTLDVLAEFFPRVARGGEAPVLATYHPLDLSDSRTEGKIAAAQETIGEYLGSARLLGRRTAEMHAALAGATSDEDFAAEPFDEKYAEILYREMMGEADRALTLLRDETEHLSATAEPLARRLLVLEASVRDHFTALRSHPVQAVRIRHHGDYHLGQVLYTGADFVIIDFEGEPARPLAARRLKTLAMRDVAGMLRSFSYAAFAALFEYLDANAASAEVRSKLEAWGNFWSAMVGAEYLGAYIQESHGQSFSSPDPAERKRLFDGFTLQKALYEVSYELNNRPSWVHIPLSGILNLV